MKNYLYILVLGFLFVQCNSNPLSVDVSNVKLSTNYLNLDSILYNADSALLMASHKDYKSSLKDLYDYQVGYCMQINSLIDTTFYNSILDYRKDEFIIRLEKSIADNFKDLNQRKTIIDEGLKHLKYHFSDGKMPTDIVFMNSLFNSNVWCSETAIGIGLDRYLGPNDECVKQLNPITFHDWVKNDWDKKYLERDAIVGWVQTHYLNEVDGSLAEEMIGWGKILYLTKAAFPDKSDAFILRYSEEEYEWAKKNEYAFWEYLVNEKLLFDNNERNAMNMLNPGPTTSGLPESGSPDRMGQYLGYRMVLSYMQGNDVMLDQLNDIPYNDILQEFEIE